MNYIKILQNYNLKATPQRLEIFNILCKNGHINIDSMHKALNSKFPSLSLATIYRNINIMCDKMLLIELKIPNQKTVYELRKEEHSHVICSQCNHILDINIDRSNILNKAEELSNFKLNKSSIIFIGICSKCLE